MEIQKRNPKHGTKHKKNLMMNQTSKAILHLSALFLMLLIGNALPMFAIWKLVHQLLLGVMIAKMIAAIIAAFPLMAKAVGTAVASITLLNAETIGKMTEDPMEDNVASMPIFLRLLEGTPRFLLYLFFFDFVD